MAWEIIKKQEVNEWNEKLKETEASFYQYPYFTDAEYSSIFSKPIFLKYIQNEIIVAYTVIIEIGLFPFKIGIIECGPIIFRDDCDAKVILEGLKEFATKSKYMYLQVRPHHSTVEQLLKKDNLFKEQLYFPFHQKEEYNWNIKNAPEDKLLLGFKLQCRRKIVLAGRVRYNFMKLKDDSELPKIHNIFKSVAREKGYKYDTPFHVFEKMYKVGQKHNLTDIYVAYLNKEIVNAIFILKDAQSFYHLSSAMILKGFHYNESPPAKLHFFLMKDCFYNEHKKYYNISYGGSENLIRFKELFNPTEIPKPPYYTFVIQQKKIHLFQKIGPEYVGSLRTFIKKIMSIFYTSKVAILIMVCIPLFNLVIKS